MAPFEAAIKNDKFLMRFTLTDGNTADINWQNGGKLKRENVATGVSSLLCELHIWVTSKGKLRAFINTIS